MNVPTRHPFALAVMLAASVTAVAAPTTVPTVERSGSRIVIKPGMHAPAFQIRLVGPDGQIAELTRLEGEDIAFEPVDAHAGWKDGQYRYEVWPITGVIRRSEHGTRPDVFEPIAPATGGFAFDDGVLYAANGTVASGSDLDTTTKDQVIADDLIVQGSACVGLDCVNNESFGTDTLRLKENNLRIAFDDTSSTAGFAANDWQLTANEQASGGLNKFSIEDITGARVPFTIIAGAPNNALYVDSTGNTGFGTSTPGLDLHVTTNDTPAMRFEQTANGGFTPQTWDIAGNEANFFIRDLTGGSRLSFRIRPGAPTSSIDIAGSGNVGIGTANPIAKLDVAGNGSIGLMGTGTGGSWRYVDDTGAPRWQAGIQGLAAETAFTVQNVVAGTEALRINASNNVGIGSHTNNNHRLFVYHNSAAGTSSLVVRQDGTGDLARFQVTGGVERARLTSGGNFTAASLATNATVTDFSPAATIIDWSAPNARITAGSGGGNNRNLVLRASNAGTPIADQLNLSFNGNVGVGTSSPIEKLHVAGNIYGSGNITITGTLSQGSDVNSKENFAAVDADDVLDKLQSLDVTRWNYKHDGKDVQHIGPMAQDFYAAFGLGEAETRIAPLDTSGVTIVAVQELARRLEERDAALRERDAEIAALRERLDRLDAQVAALVEARQPAATAVSIEAEASPKTTGL